MSEQNVNEEFCPECPNHCPKDALKCGRGRAHFGLEERGPRKKPEEMETVEELLRYCGHALHHGNKAENLLGGLTDEESTTLLKLLKKMAAAW